MAESAETNANDLVSAVEKAIINDDPEAKAQLETASEKFWLFAAAKLLSSTKPDETDRLVAFIVEMMSKYEINIKDLEAAGSVNPEALTTTVVLPSCGNTVSSSSGIATANTRDIAPPLLRDWRDARGNDPGYAVRQAYLQQHPWYHS